jgi:galactose mutarotase-like enzyme
MEPKVEKGSLFYGHLLFIASKRYKSGITTGVARNITCAFSPTHPACVCTSASSQRISKEKYTKSKSSYYLTVTELLQLGERDAVLVARLFFASCNKTAERQNSDQSSDKFCQQQQLKVLISCERAHATHDTSLRII